MRSHLPPGSQDYPRKAVHRSADDLAVGQCMLKSFDAFVGCLRASEHQSLEFGQPLRRRAALKVIKPGMDSKAVVARFEAERQALALMDHPNIGHVLDAGSTAAGRPYFVMEYVRGVPITEYCDQNRLTIRERLELFIQVCQAIQHAHQKGIVHRDIKPSNVLFTLHDGKPVATSERQCLTLQFRRKQRRGGDSVGGR
jgi:serine/threonine protein kinase